MSPSHSIALGAGASSLPGGVLQFLAQVCLNEAYGNFRIGRDIPNIGSRYAYSRDFVSRPLIARVNLCPTTLGIRLMLQQENKGE